MHWGVSFRTTKPLSLYPADSVETETTTLLLDETHRFGLLWSVNHPNVSLRSNPYLNSASMSSPRPVKRGHDV
jgi:hypothetical protein